MPFPEFPGRRSALTIRPRSVRGIYAQRPDQSITLDELATHSGRDRWSLSRDFRLLFGTSPIVT